jgi:hypothetical protein
MNAVALGLALRFLSFDFWFLIFVWRVFSPSSHCNIGRPILPEKLR